MAPAHPSRRLRGSSAIRTIVSAVAALALSGCSDLLGPGAPTLSVSLSLERWTTPAPVLHADVGGKRLVVHATSSSGSGTELRGPRYGEVPVRVSLLTAAGDTLGSVAFSQRFQRGHLHWVSAVLGVRRPAGHCIGAQTATPVRGTADTLFVMYGGIPEGAVC